MSVSERVCLQPVVCIGITGHYVIAAFQLNDCLLLSLYCFLGLHNHL